MSSLCLTKIKFSRMLKYLYIIAYFCSNFYIVAMSFRHIDSPRKTIWLFFSSYLTKKDCEMWRLLQRSWHFPVLFRFRRWVIITEKKKYSYYSVLRGAYRGVGGGAGNHPTTQCDHIWKVFVTKIHPATSDNERYVLLANIHYNTSYFSAVTVVSLVAAPASTFCTSLALQLNIRT